MLFLDSLLLFKYLQPFIIVELQLLIKLNLILQFIEPIQCHVFDRLLLLVGLDNSGYLFVVASPVVELVVDLVENVVSLEPVIRKKGTLQVRRWLCRFR